MANTRLRDFYDIHVLWGTWGGRCDPPTLSAAIDATCEKHGSSRRIARWEAVLDEAAVDATMFSLWGRYVRIISARRATERERKSYERNAQR